MERRLCLLHSGESECLQGRLWGPSDVHDAGRALPGGRGLVWLHQLR
ncbi:hypothetical protein MAR_013808 [Mya arenaria]|uniref:Uncharacterized protein n=1 Tax=Mya arenaria TaxID=6604 RepID=A0ABY7G3Z7_MYAAR|nr:hypothetical protein MAR_013808 [Mya arenaria]